MYTLNRSALLPAVLMGSGGRYCSCNLLTNLDGLEGLEKLATLSVAQNSIADGTAMLEVLAELPSLKVPRAVVLLDMRPALSGMSTDSDRVC